MEAALILEILIQTMKIAGDRPPRFTVRGGKNRLKHEKPIILLLLLILEILEIRL